MPTPEQFWKLQDTVKRLKERNAELEALFNLQYAAMAKAIVLWQAAHPAERDVQPGLGRLLDWLMETKGDDHGESSDDERTD